MKCNSAESLKFCYSLTSNSLGHQHSPAKWNTGLVLFNWMHGSEESNIMMPPYTQRISLEDDGDTEGDNDNVRQMLFNQYCDAFLRYTCWSISQKLYMCAGSSLH